ncbi:MAG: hypothetical protein QF745_11270 [Planctomycetota bacterium]|nr:hypothetical protein [Planctomycetota bacterium]
MSPVQLLKRALVSVLLEVARTYCLDLSLSRDSADADVKKAIRRVIVKAHPDKPGGSVSATVRLNEAWAKWCEAARDKGKAGRPTNASTGGALVPAAARKRKGYRIQSAAVMLTYQGVAGVSDWHAFLEFVARPIRQRSSGLWGPTLWV